MAATDTSPGTVKAIEELKRLQPQSLCVHLAEGRDLSVAVPSRKRKWAALAVTLDKLRWDTLEALDGKGQVLGIVENEETGGLEDLEFDGNAGEVSRHLQLMLHAQDVALSRQTALIDKMLSNNLELSRVLMSRLNALETSHANALETLNELMTDRPAGELTSGDAIMEMLGKVAESKSRGNDQVPWWKLKR